MRLKKLLRKDIEPRCTYCAHGVPLADGQRIVCRRRGVVDGVQAPEFASMPMDEAIAADKAMAEEPPAERHAAEREAACARRRFKLV